MKLISNILSAIILISAYVVAQKTQKPFTITVYNPIARRVNATIRVPVSSKFVKVFGMDSKRVPFAIQPVTEITKFVRGKLGNAPYQLVFSAVNVPPTCFSMYQVDVTSKAETSIADNQRSSKKRDLKANSDDYVIKNKVSSVNILKQKWSSC